MKRHAKQIARNNAPKAVPAIPAAAVSTTLIADVNSAKKAKKEQKKEANRERNEKYERRQSGDFPPALSVRVDDLAEEDGDEESKADRKVRFGEPQSKGTS